VIPTRRPILTPREAAIFAPSGFGSLGSELLELIDLTDPDIEYIADSVAHLRFAGLDVTDVDIFQMAIDGGRKKAAEANDDLGLRSSAKAERDRACEESNQRYAERLELRCKVYYMRIGNRCKIGYSANVRQRMGQIMPEELLATERGGPTLEFARHEQFKGLRTRGEWFRYEGRLVEHVESLRGLAA
jgi:hypothetical protein